MINKRKEPAEAKAVYSAEHKAIGGAKIGAFGALFNFWDRIKLSRRHMGDGKIGFNPPENPDVTLEKKVEGRTYLIKKARQKDGSFIYSCERRRIESKTAQADMWVGFETEQDLALDQVENRTQFLEFMSGNLSK